MRTSTRLILTVLVLTLGLTGCNSIPKELRDFDELSLEELWDLARGKKATKDDQGWMEGPQEIDGRGLNNWRLAIQVKDQDMSRANGAPERITIGFKLSGIDYKVYCMVGGRDGIRARAKGDVNVHVQDSVYAPIPKIPSEWVWTAKDGKLNMTINGVQCRYHPFEIGDATLKAVYWSPDGSRPAGCKVKLGAVEAL